MPNHVANVVKMEGIAKLPLFATEYDEYKKKDVTRLDFDKLIPMPESLNIESGSMTDEAIIYYVTDKCTLPLRAISSVNKQLVEKNVDNLSHAGSWAEEVFMRVLERTHDMTKAQKEEFYKKGETYVANLHNYGHATWYNWRIEHWGTKWNAYECVIEDNQITFETAWSNPEPIINKLAEMYPNSYIEHIWADEDMGNNSGYREYLDGQWYGGYDDTKQEAYQHYIDCWGKTDCLYKDDDGNWQKHDCDTCHLCY